MLSPALRSPWMWSRAVAVAALVAGAAVAAGCGPADAQAPAPKTAATGDDPPEPKGDDTATIDAFCNPPTKVLIDGKPVGTSPISGYKVKPGSHDVTFADELTGNRTMTVVLEPGDGKTVTSDRPPSATQTQKPEKPEKPAKGK
jgi:hypothetical protein